MVTKEELRAVRRGQNTCDMPFPLSFERGVSLDRARALARTGLRVTIENGDWRRESEEKSYVIGPSDTDPGWWLETFAGVGLTCLMALAPIAQAYLERIGGHPSVVHGEQQGSVRGTDMGNPVIVDAITTTTTATA